MESVSYDGSRSGGVNWSHPMNNSSHLPPKSPGAASYSMFSSSTSLFDSSVVPQGHRRTPSAGYVAAAPGQVGGGWLSGGGSLDVVLKKCSHRRSSSDSVAFVDTSYQYMNYLENVTEEEEFVLPEVPSFPAAFRPAHRRGLSADHGSGDQFLMTHMSHSEKGMRGEHNISREQFQRQFQKPRAEMIPAYNRVIGAKQQPELAAGKAKLRQQVAATSRSESTNSFAVGGGRWSSNNATFENRSTASESNSHSDDSNDDPRVKSYDRGEDEGGDGEGACTSSTDPVDPKKAKRILANRQSAQRSRVRKLQYISELEMNVNLLETEVASLSPKVGYFDQERKLLSAENMLLKQKLAQLAKSQRAKDVYNETLKSELNRLRQLHNNQQQAHQYNTQQQVQQPIQRPVSTEALDLQLLRFSKLDLGPPKIPRGPGRPSLYPNRIPSNHSNSSTNNHGNRVPPSCMAPGGALLAPFRESSFGQN